MSKNGKRKSKTGWIIFLVLLIILALALLTGVWWFIDQLKPVSANSEPKTVEVTDGETFNDLTQQLEKEGLIKNAAAAQIYTKIHGDAGYYSGKYQLNPSMSTQEILAYIANPDNLQKDYAVITVPEGSWAKEVAAELANNLTQYTAQDFLNLWNDNDYINTLSADYPFLNPAIVENDQYFVKLEGYLFPDTYHVDYNMTPDQITRMFLDRFRTEYDSIAPAVEASGRSLEEILTLASIVQFESGDAAVMPDIARVFYNRLDQGMPLESSVTVCYSLYDQFNSPQDCETQTDIDSPYNTYLYQGLPPGPINNPGQAAISAVLNPADNDYLFFVADIHGDGSVHFATTYEEHEANIEKYNLTITE